MKKILTTTAAILALSAGAAFADPLQAGSQANQPDRPELRGHEAGGEFGDIQPLELPFFGLDMFSTQSIEEDPNAPDEVDPGTVDEPVIVQE